ncbi:Uncharacterised protein [Amycolatopsis camponoti]|uniref:Uncharacterized protein n=1 Tax=Amycolatopsis camponoti TaxID=2606593 RepID=A0A6I8M1W3_9PSEU|nr:Uncharacterised protein [Amycolatopsis camponoti]
MDHRPPALARSRQSVRDPKLRRATVTGRSAVATLEAS